MRVYISGKISGLKDLNIFKFEGAEMLLKHSGHEPVNPHKLPMGHLPKNSEGIIAWHHYMRNDLRVMLMCDSVCVLDDWKQSRGAIIEAWLACRLRMPVFEFETMEHIHVGFFTVIRLLFLRPIR